MKATLYEALGISPRASDEEVRAGLRRQIRKYYANTRDGHGNVEEALRFINHASCILGDPQRRALYDHELAVSDGSDEQRIAHVVSSAVAKQTDQRIDAARATGRPGFRRGASAPSAEPAGLTERVAWSFHRSTGVAIALCTVFAAMIGLAIVWITPTDVVAVAKQVLVAVTVALLVLTLIYAVVHAVAWARRSGIVQRVALIPEQDLAILNWRRQRSVFLGTNQPHEDASWIFQLRMAELERAKGQRTSQPHPWNRLSARLFDYALWGLVLAVPLVEMSALGLLPDALGYWLVHPLIAPVLITASWVPIEALLSVYAHTTPGKWLFGVYLQFSISEAYAKRSKRSQLDRASRRAFRVWWEGMGCGFPLVAPILIAFAYEKVEREEETGWDSAEDCLVTHSPTGGLNTATGVAGLAAMMWVYALVWYPAVDESTAWARDSISALSQSASAWRASLGAGKEPARSDSTRSTAADGHNAPRRANPDEAAVRPRERPVAVPERYIARPTERQRSVTVSGTVQVPSTAMSTTSASANSALPLDATLAREFAARQARVKMLRTEAPRMIEVGNWRRARELCRQWVDLELGNPDAWRCLGRALQGEGHHREAINALRKAKQLDPGDPTIDASITRSQRGIVTEFLQRQGG